MSIAMARKPMYQSNQEKQYICHGTNIIPFENIIQTHKTQILPYEICNENVWYTWFNIVHFLWRSLLWLRAPMNTTIASLKSHSIQFLGWVFKIAECRFSLNGLGKVLNEQFSIEVRQKKTRTERESRSGSEREIDDKIKLPGIYIFSSLSLLSHLDCNRNAILNEMAIPF